MKENIFEKIPNKLKEELFEDLITAKNFKLQRIVSRGQVTPREAWFDSPEAEWVILLKGKARLLFEKNNQEIWLSPGDYIHIPAHCRHRVEWTDREHSTVWLALNYCPE